MLLVVNMTMRVYVIALNYRFTEAEKKPHTPPASPLVPQAAEKSIKNSILHAHFRHVRAGGTMQHISSRMSIYPSHTENLVRFIAV